MATRFDFKRFDHHDFFHVRMGRGAIVVAAERLEGGEPPDPRQTLRSLHAAMRYEEQTNGSQRSKAPRFDRVVDIEESDGLVWLSIEVTLERKMEPVPVKTVFQRAVPATPVLANAVHVPDRPHAVRALACRGVRGPGRCRDPGGLSQHRHLATASMSAQGP